MTWVGRSLKRFEDAPLLTGRARFVADAAIGARAVRFVRSPIAAGRIAGIDIPDGVSAVTGADLIGVKPFRPRLNRPDFTPIEQPILPADRVRFVGEPVVAVIAETPEAAEDAVDRVDVRFEPTPAVTDFASALKSDAPRVHDHAPANTVVDAKIRPPAVEAAFAAAAHTVTIEIRSGRQSAFPLETRGARADYDPATGRTTLTVSTQMPHIVRTGLADVLGMREDDLRVIAPAVGGGFGQKMCPTPEYVVLIWLARRMKGSFAWIEDRHENLMASFHGRDQAHTVKGAFAADGKLLAIDVDLLCNIGAYSCFPVTHGVEPLMAMAEFPGPYDFPAYAARARAITTNTCSMAPYRGVSRPVITLAMERLMDTAAAKLGLDPVAIRRRNLVATFPYTSATGIKYDAGAYREALEIAAEKVDLPGFRARQIAARTDGRYLGIGFATFNERTGYGTPAFAPRLMEVTLGYETVEVAMDPSGFVEARIGASPHGQGLATTLAQIVADELGIAPDTIRVIHGDTDRTPYGWGTFASRGIVIVGGACKIAAAKLAVRLRALAATLLQADAGKIELADGRAALAGGPSSIAIADLARAAYHQAHQFKDQPDIGLSARASYDPAGTFSNACHVAIVEVDVETGGVRLERFVAVEDAGRLVNPTIVDGQVRGGIVQGIANALYEEILYDRTGNILTTSLMDYAVPTAAEIPPIELHHLETITDASITGAKGVGEGGAIGAPAAVINAVADAVAPLGVAVYEMPIAPQRLRALIRAATGKQR
ncbi:MAG: xanthine dehydrogenase family protein molybdopterin-binding subunit [Alphaproteobacteria bacterium]|nr:xanthine dehydrogenase family protein molybdopterin-binding subunit [Alphaproteobacteria bacterium]